MIDGFFKVKQAGQPDCTQEGLTVGRAAFHMINKAFRSRDTNDAVAAFLLVSDFSARCNYWPTVQGGVVNLRLVDRLWRSDVGDETREMLVTLVQAMTLGSTAVDFGLVAAGAIGGFSAHWDPYNAAKGLSRLVLLVYTMGFILDG